MRVRGVIRGQAIELDKPTNLPDGQEVQIDVLAENEPAKLSDAEADQTPIVKVASAGIEREVSPNVLAADKLRMRIAARWGTAPDRSAQYIREDRDR